MKVTFFFASTKVGFQLSNIGYMRQVFFLHFVKWHCQVQKSKRNIIVLVARPVQVWPWPCSSDWLYPRLPEGPPLSFAWKCKWQFNSKISFVIERGILIQKSSTTILWNCLVLALWVWKNIVKMSFIFVINKIGNFITLLNVYRPFIHVCTMKTPSFCPFIIKAMP